MALALGSSGSLAAPRQLVAGIQLWAVRSVAETDLAGTLGRLAAMGYREVESYSFGVRPIQSDRVAGYAPDDFHRAVRRAGLRCPSVHIALGGEDLHQAIEAAHAVGASYAVSSIRRGTGAAPYDGPQRDGYLRPMSAMTLNDAHETARLANHVGATLKKAGLQYCYHNHYFEFVALEDGSCAYDVLWQETDPDLVKFEIDCGWMMVAGHDPVTYIKRNPARVPMLHIKDFLAPSEGQTEGRSGALRLGSELGRGVLDYRPIFDVLLRSRVQHVFAEQEGPFQRMDQLAAANVAFSFLEQGLIRRPTGLRQ
jgi:sugar phosphate isomerase/epimerase